MLPPFPKGEGVVAKALVGGGLALLPKGNEMPGVGEEDDAEPNAPN